MLPIVAACGGMIVPVLCFLFFCHTAPGMRGMAIPMATDIAFALAVLALLGKQVPASLKVFLTALAVADDIGGIIIIALFYNTGISIIPLLLSLGILLALYVGGRMFVNSNAFYLVGGFLVWMLFLESGVHPTIAGVLVAFTIPARPVIQLDKFVDTMDHLLRILPLAQSKKSPNATVLTSSQIQILKNIESTADGAISPLQDIMDDLNPLVDYLILPLFAFVNAGVALGSIPPESLSGVPLAVFAGLFIGKALGIFSFSYVFIRSGIVSYPSGMNRNNLMALSMLGGVGFTVSLFIANLSYTSLPGLGGDLLNQAKLGVFAGSLSAGVCGYFWLKYTLNKSGKKVFMR